MAKNEQSRTPRKRAAGAKAPAAESRRVERRRSVAGAVRRPRSGRGEEEVLTGEAVPAEAVSAEAVSAEAVSAEAVSAEAAGAGVPQDAVAQEPAPSPAEGQEVHATPAAPGPADVTPAPAERRAEAERVVRELLGHMGHSARLELRDAPDGGLAMAVHFEGGLPPWAQAGRRTPVMDALQFIANKLLNKPGQERRWLSLGALGFPEPRVPGGKKPARAPAPVAAARATPTPQAPTPQAAPQAPAARPERPARGGEPDERTLQVSEDAALAEAVRALAERSARLGRFYAILSMDAASRARVVQAAAGVPEVRVHAEGEGRHRRVVFTPAKPAPLPKRNALPDWDDEDEEG